MALPAAWKTNLRNLDRSRLLHPLLWLFLLALAARLIGLTYHSLWFDEVVSTVGSGDSFLAGFVACHFQRWDPGDCLRFGLACGAANTQKYGAGTLESDVVDRLIATAVVEEVVETASE